MRIGKLFDPHRTRMDMPARMTPAVWICRGIMSILTVTRIARYTRALVLRSALRRLEKFLGRENTGRHTSKYSLVLTLLRKHTNHRVIGLT